MLVLLVSVSVSGCGRSTPEGEWESFVSDVKRHDGDAAAKHVDFERWLGANSKESSPSGPPKSKQAEELDVKWAEMMVGTIQEGTVDLFFNEGEVPIGPIGTPVDALQGSPEVSVRGGTANLVFPTDGGTAVAKMQRRWSRWRIIDFRLISAPDGS